MVTPIDVSPPSFAFSPCAFPHTWHDYQNPHVLPCQPYPPRPNIIIANAYAAFLSRIHRRALRASRSGSKDMRPLAMRSQGKRCQVLCSFQEGWGRVHVSRGFQAKQPQTMSDAPRGCASSHRGERPPEGRTWDRPRQRRPLGSVVGQILAGTGAEEFKSCPRRLVRFNFANPGNVSADDAFRSVTEVNFH